MKKYILKLSALLLFSFCTSCGNDDDSTNIDLTAIVNITDSSFKDVLVGDSAINTNGDNEIQVSEASAYTGNIDVRDKGITNLTGIEEFIKATGLFASNNNISSMDISKNTKLTRIGVFGNQLISIDVSNNIELNQLLVENNQLTTIDLSMLSKLTDFKGNSNKLSGIVNIANGNNINMTRVQMLGNPDLQCVKTDAGFVPTSVWRLGSATSGDCL